MHAGRRGFDFGVLNAREIIKRVSSLGASCRRSSVLGRPCITGARLTVYSSSPETQGANDGPDSPWYLHSLMK